MATAAILNLLFLFILVKCSISGGSRLHYCKISFIYVNPRLKLLPICLCSMEVVWHGEFERLFNTFPHQWLLKPISSVDTTEQLNTAGEYTIFQDSAKVRFLCKVYEYE